MFTRKPTLSFCSILAVLTIFNAAVAAEHKSKCEQRSSTSLDAGESGFEQIVGQYNAMVSAAKAGLKRRPNEVGTWTVSASEIHYLELSGISKSCASSGRKKLCKGAECDFFYSRCGRLYRWRLSSRQDVRSHNFGSDRHDL